MVINEWYIKLALTLSVGFLVLLAEYFVYKKFLPRLQKNQRIWQSALLSALHRPLQTYVWALLVTAVIQILSGHFKIDVSYFTVLGAFRQVATLLFFLWFAMRFIRLAQNAFIQATKVGSFNKAFRDNTSIHAVAQLMRIVVLVVILLVFLQSIGVGISTLLTFGGIGGLAITYAGKDTLSNFIGGMMIYWDRPFSVGDWIRSPDKNIEGTVEYIGWRLTRIRTFDKRPLYVPNGTFSSISLENPSRMTNRRIKTTIGIRYDDATKVAKIVADIEEMLKNHPEIDTKQTLFVKLVEFGASSLNILIYVFTKTTQWVKFQAIQEDVFLKIIDIVSSHGAEFAFPTNTIHFAGETNPYQLKNEGPYEQRLRQHDRI